MPGKPRPTKRSASKKPTRRSTGPRARARARAKAHARRYPHVVEHTDGTKPHEPAPALAKKR